MRNTMKTLKTLGGAAVVGLTLYGAGAQAQTMTIEQAHRQITPFYEMLNKPATKDLKALAERAMSPDWKSYASETDFKGRDAFVAQVTGFGKLIPDLSWDIKEVLVQGDRIIVRSEASGTPAGPIFGVQPGGRSFKIMAIDIHTIKDGKAITAYHVEDWAGAIRQLTAK
ncbi:MAG: ester cyclase [Burkholderiales bacterium]